VFTRAGLALVLSLIACSRSEEHAKPAPPPAPVEPSKPKLTAAWLGKTAARPPGDLGKLAFGTPIADAAKLVPWVAPSGQTLADVADTTLAVQKTLDNKGVGDLLVMFPADAKGAVAAAWGPGVDADRGGNPVTVWFDPEHGVRAALSVDDQRATLRFEPYLPLAKLLGPGTDVAVFDKPYLGLTVAEAAKNYASLMNGKALVLPPTEYEFSDSTLAFFYPNDAPDAKVKSLSIGFGYGAHPKLLAELTAAFEAKWGKPKGHDAINEKSLIYNASKPHIEIADTTYGTKTVSITISEK
jgi:hypothetical protein